MAFYRLLKMTQTRLKSGFTLVFLQILVQMAESAATNVAATGTFCSTTNLTNKLFDGDTMNVEILFPITESCPYKRTIINIAMSSDYYVDYVILYTGKGNDRGQLDFFLVERRFIDLVIVVCSQYPGFANVAETGHSMRLNCNPVRDMFTSVAFTFYKQEQLHITEIEIHSIGFGTSLLYAGCFEAFHFNLSYTWPACQIECFLNGYITIAVKSDKTCHCVARVVRGKEIPAKYCSVKCDDGVRSCGGPESYSVYRLRPSLPAYQGCYETSENFTKESTLSGDMTVAKCLQHCDQYLYALVQGGDFCICQDRIIEPREYNIYGCDLKCTGDESFVCGGREHAVVFLSCKKSGVFSSDEPCSVYLLCANSFDMHGVCQGGCKQGFTGDHCLEKVESSHLEQIKSLVPLISIPIFLLVLLASLFGYKAMMNQESLIVDDNTVIRRTVLK